MARQAVSDKTGRSFPWGFCRACGTPMETPGQHYCNSSCVEAYRRGKRPVGLTGVRYDEEEGGTRPER